MNSLFKARFIVSKLIKPSQQYVFVRNFGIMDSIRDSVTKKSENMQQKQMKEAFTNMMNTMKTIDKFKLKDAKEMLAIMTEKSGVDGWRSKIPGVSKMEEIKDVKARLAIFNNFTEKELEDARIIDRRVKERVANSSNCTVKDVDQALMFFDEQKMIHKYVQTRLHNNLSLPETSEELVNMIREDPRGISKNQIMRTMYSGKSDASIRAAATKGNRQTWKNDVRSKMHVKKTV
ncbi:hypothetical protein WA158_001670 [Blastocystis sp. Blastoise]